MFHFVVVGWQELHLTIQDIKQCKSKTKKDTCSLWFGKICIWLFMTSISTSRQEQCVFYPMVLKHMFLRDGMQNCCFCPRVRNNDVSRDGTQRICGTRAYANIILYAIVRVRRWDFGIWMKMELSFVELWFWVSSFLSQWEWCCWGGKTTFEKSWLQAFHFEIKTVSFVCELVRGASRQAQASWFACPMSQCTFSFLFVS